MLIDYDGKVADIVYIMVVVVVVVASDYVVGHNPAACGGRVTPKN